MFPPIAQSWLNCTRSPDLKIESLFKVKTGSPRAPMTCARPFLFFIVAVVLLSPSWTTASAAEKKVLFMYGDRSNGVIMAYREVLQSAMRVGSPDRITFYEEYMDLVLYPGEDYISLLRGFYRQKYKDQR